MTAARGFIGAGDVYLNRIVSGVAQGMTGPYYAEKFEIKPNLKKLPLKSFALATYGQTLEDVSVQEPATFTINLSETNKVTLAAGLFGTVYDTSQTSGTLTAEVIVAKLGFWVPLSKDTLTDDPTVTNSGASVTYIKDVDYEVNGPMGWIRALVGGAITADESLKVTATYGAYTGSLIAGVTVTTVETQIVFVGINLVDKTPVIARIRQGVIASDTVLDLLGADFTPIVLSGTMATPVGYDEPFTVELRSA